MKKLLLFFAVLFSQCAHANEYPTRPITIVCPFPPGGGTLEAVARILSDKLHDALGQPVLVESIGGAGGIVPVGKVFRSTPDGYTLVLGHTGTHVFNALMENLSYDVRGFEPIITTNKNSMLLVSNNKIHASDVSEVISWIKTNDAAFAITGYSTPSAIVAALFKQRYNLKFQEIPYRTVSQAQQDIMGGRIHFMFDQAPGSTALAQSGNINALFVTAAQRLSSLPSTKTAKEFGITGFEVEIWGGLWAPKGTPQSIIEKLNIAVRKSLINVDVKRKYESLAAEIPDDLSSSGLQNLQERDLKRWSPIIKTFNE